MDRHLEALRSDAVTSLPRTLKPPRLGPQRRLVVQAIGQPVRMRRQNPKGVASSRSFAQACSLRGTSLRLGYKSSSFVRMFHTQAGTHPIPLEFAHGSRCSETRSPGKATSPDSSPHLPELRCPCPSVRVGCENVECQPPIRHQAVHWDIRHPDTRPSWMPPFQDTGTQPGGLIQGDSKHPERRVDQREAVATSSGFSFVADIISQQRKPVKSFFSACRPPASSASPRSCGSTQVHAEPSSCLPWLPAWRLARS